MTTTPGYVLPNSTFSLPKQLNLIQFIQTVLVGISGIDGTLIRPKWQIAPPKQPDISVNWISFGIQSINPDSNSFVGVDSSGITNTRRHEDLEIPLSIYGPDAYSNIDLIRDGFQIQANRNALFVANMGFVGVGNAIYVPDLINERWFNRIQMSIFLRREIQRTYPIPVLISTHGVIHTIIGDEQYLLDWAT